MLRWPYHENDRAQAERETHGHIKVITDKERANPRRHHRRRACRRADHHLDAGAVAQRLNIRAMAGIVVPYPTLSEIGKRAAITYFPPSLTQSMGAAHHRLAAPFRVRYSGAARLTNDRQSTATGRRARARTRHASGCPASSCVLTILFVMIAEVLIYVPSIANFRLNWLATASRSRTPPRWCYATGRRGTGLPDRQCSPARCSGNSRQLGAKPSP